MSRAIEYAVRRFVAALSDDSAAVRADAARALAVLPDPLAIPMLRAHLADDEAGVREGCARALGELKDGESYPLLVELLRRDSDEQVLVATIEALGLLGDPDAIPPLQEVRRRILLSASLRAACSQALQRLQAVGNLPRSAVANLSSPAETLPRAPGPSASPAAHLPRPSGES